MGSVYGCTWLKVMATLDGAIDANISKFSNVSGLDSNPNPDTGIDLDVSACSSSSTSKWSSLPLLSTLRAPKPSDLARNRKVAYNSAPRSGKRHKVRGSSLSSSEPKSVTPAQRVQQYPSEQLNISVGKLFCKACREELSLKSSSVANHVKSTKHVDGKKRLEIKQAHEQDIARALSVHNEQTHLKGETLPEQQQVFHVKVVSSFLKAAVPLSKLDSFREIFEESAYCLGDRRNMSDLVPFIHKHEQAMICDEIKGRHISIIFDGTTRLGEALAVVIHFVSDDWSLLQRLVRLQILAKSVSEEELARELISILSITYSITSDQLLAAMRDWASVNTAALRTIKVVYPKMIDIGCFSHTLDCVGEHFCTPNLTEFVSAWISLFAHSPKTRLMWREQTGRSMATFSPTRWWSRWEVMDQLLTQFGDVLPFLQNEEIGSPAIGAKLLAIVADAQEKAFIELKLAATVDWGQSFINATYLLEGDGPLVVERFEII